MDWACHKREPKPDALFLCAPILDYRAWLGMAIWLASKKSRSFYGHMQHFYSLVLSLLTLQLCYLVITHTFFCLVVSNCLVKAYKQHLVKHFRIHYFTISNTATLFFCFFPITAHTSSRVTDCFQSTHSTVIQMSKTYSPLQAFFGSWKLCQLKTQSHWKNNSLLSTKHRVRTLLVQECSQMYKLLFLSVRTNVSFRVWFFAP